MMAIATTATPQAADRATGLGNVPSVWEAEYWLLNANSVTGAVVLLIGKIRYRIIMINRSIERIE
ncbi:MAG: hypothetical protein AB1489_03445 [Acidobacteriota bacterium]